jgi:hypothetical protein
MGPLGLSPGTLGLLKSQVAAGKLPSDVVQANAAQITQDLRGGQQHGHHGQHGGQPPNPTLWAQIFTIVSPAIVLLITPPMAATPPTPVTPAP